MALFMNWQLNNWFMLKRQIHSKNEKLLCVWRHNMVSKIYHNINCSFIELLYKINITLALKLFGIKHLCDIVLITFDKNMRQKQIIQASVFCPNILGR